MRARKGRKAGPRVIDVSHGAEEAITPLAIKMGALKNILIPYISLYDSLDPCSFQVQSS